MQSLLQQPHRVNGTAPNGEGRLGPAASPAATEAPPAAQEPRQIKDGPFCWQSKAALRRLREGLDGQTFLDQALAVYLVHTELSSNSEGGPHKARIAVIAERSGVSRRRVLEIHERLRALGLLTWEQNRIDGTKELGANTYTLTGLCTPSTTPGTECTTSGTHSTRLCKNAKSDFCTELEETQNKVIEQRGEEGAAAPPARARSAFKKPTLEEATAYGKEISMPASDVTHWLDYFDSNGWRIGGRAPMRDWRASMRTWQRNSAKFAPKQGTGGNFASLLRDRKLLEAELGTKREDFWMLSEAEQKQRERECSVLTSKIADINARMGMPGNDEGGKHAR